MALGNDNSERAVSNDAALSSYAAVQRDAPPAWQATLWPHRSLGRTGFRNTMIVAGIGLAIPCVALMFTSAWRGVLPFALAMFALLWLAIRANNRQARLHEHIGLWPDLIAVERHEVNGDIKRWQANPYWMRTKLLPKGGPVENYLTLTGNAREIELGAFLSPHERAALQQDIERAIRALGQRPPD